MGALDGLGGTGILSQLRYLNIDQQLPTTGVRQQHAKGIKNSAKPAVMHRDLELPRSEMGWSQLKIDINCYPCRTAYGYLNNTDFAKKYGQQGFQDLAAATSKHTNRGWQAAKSGGIPGRNVLIEQAKSDFWSQVVQWRGWQAVKIPDPEFTVHPSQVHGQMKVGHDGYNISTTPRAEVQIRTGSAETYMKDQGFINRWLSVGRYDMSV